MFCCFRFLTIFSKWWAVSVGEETLYQLRIVIFRLQPNRANPAGCVVICERNPTWQSWGGGKRIAAAYLAVVVILSIGTRLHRTPIITKSTPYRYTPEKCKSHIKVQWFFGLKRCESATIKIVIYFHWILKTLLLHKSYKMKNFTRDKKTARVKPVGLWNKKNCEIEDLELGKYYAKARRMKSIDEIKNLEKCDSARWLCFHCIDLCRLKWMWPNCVARYFQLVRLIEKFSLID